jgi:hypothetical protein
VRWRTGCGAGRARATGAPAATPRPPNRASRCPGPRSGSRRPGRRGPRRSRGPRRASGHRNHAGRPPLKVRARARNTIQVWGPGGYRRCPNVPVAAACTGCRDAPVRSDLSVWRELAGVAGSSPAEGSRKPPAQGGFSLPGVVRTALRLVRGPLLGRTLGGPYRMRPLLGRGRR